MGALISKQLDKSFEKQMEFQREAQRMQVMRQLSMQNLMRERAMAMQISQARDTFYWVASFSTMVALGSTVSWFRTKDPRVTAPLLPLVFLTGYFYDLGYGDKIPKIKRDAENILLETPELVSMPLGMPTFDEIETRRENSRLEEDLIPNELFL